MPPSFLISSTKSFFRSLEFRHRHSAELAPIPKFFQAINARDAHALSLAPLVQELSFLFWSSKGSFWNNIVVGSFEKILNGVFSLSNLTKLAMNRCVTSPTIVKQLGKLVQLQSLHTHRCYYWDDDSEKRYQMLFPIYNPCTRLNAMMIVTVATSVDTWLVSH